ncbi:MAG: Flp pilus assembly protein TadD [Planctomycetota bacterium]|jgi:Flp pilus assembly protein TadD
MQEVGAETVLGDFADVTFEEGKRTAHFFRKGAEYWVKTEGPDGEPNDFKVVYTFGADPLQQYLVEFPGGRYQCLDIAWDINQKRWFDLFPETDVAPDDEYHWTGRFQSWNLQCADCHSTFFEKNYDIATDTYSSTWKEINVGCESCHGPASGHVDLAREWAASDGRPDYSDSGLVVDLKKADPAGVLNSCAACHSRRTALSSSHEIGASFEDDYRISTLTPDLYHLDGQIREEVYVMGSFQQSKMHEKGVSCIDCHDPHSLDLWLPGDSTCLQCHSEQAPTDRFPTLLQKAYADPSHHFHPIDSEGARCVNCHMPETTYMVIDPRRDHSLRVPRPDLTESIGTPNACNGCHETESASWASNKITEWYGKEPAAHYGTALAATMTGERSAIEALMALPFDREQPTIVRASATEQLPAGTQVAMQAAMALLGDEGSGTQLRLSALALLLDGPPQLLVALLPEYLDDPCRAIRIETAHVLAGEAEKQLDEAQTKLFEAAFAEFEAAQLANADSPFAHLNLGVIHERRGKKSFARAAYKKALTLDSGFLPAVFNLASLLSTEGKAAEAEALLRKAIAQFPEEGELNYSLGLLLAGTGQLEASTEALAKAARFMPNRPRVQYNLGLAYSQLGRNSEAEIALITASKLQPDEPDFIYALSTFYLGIDDFEQALDAANRLIVAVPESPGPKQLREEILKRLNEKR